ncbi:MAG TPA: cysteine desulfurase [Gammaproteobacteria bacterium]|nr:cysteine desulfurase [Gammaproteobacteria bacterium]
MNAPSRQIAESSTANASVAPFEVARVRAEFPILATSVHGKPLVYLDNAATTQKPRAVIEATSRYYETINANVHRGVHTLSQRATDEFEAAREAARRFLNAAEAREIVFTRGTTEAINLIAQSYAREFLRAGDEILIGAAEHHANIVPWQMLAKQRGTVLKVAPIDERGELDMAAFEALLSARTKLVAIGHVSNALGTVNPVGRIVALAHAAGAKVLIDGAQSVAHAAVDVRALDCDFFAFSGHKLFGPTGIGVLYAKAALLEAMPPWQGGGDMIKTVSFEHTEFNDIPYKFEAGTPDIAGAIGLKAAFDWLAGLDFAGAIAHERAVLARATAALREFPDLRPIGTAREKAAVLSFVIDGVHPQDLGVLLDSQGIAIRTGHHCAMPVMQHYGLVGTARASFALYNTFEDVDRFVSALAKARDILR